MFLLCLYSMFFCIFIIEVQKRNYRGSASFLICCHGRFIIEVQKRKNTELLRFGHKKKSIYLYLLLICLFVFMYFCISMYFFIWGPLSVLAY